MDQDKEDSAEEDEELEQDSSREMTTTIIKEGREVGIFSKIENQAPYGENYLYL